MVNQALPVIFKQRAEYLDFLSFRNLVRVLDAMLV